MRGAVVKSQESAKTIETAVLCNGQVLLPRHTVFKKQPISFDNAMICEKLLAFSVFQTL